MMNKIQKVKAKRQTPTIKQPIYVQTYPTVGALVTGLTSSPSIMADEINPSATLLMKTSPMVTDFSLNKTVHNDDEHQQSLSEPIDNQSRPSSASQHIDSTFDSGLSTAEISTIQETEKSHIDDELSSMSGISSIHVNESNTVDSVVLSEDQHTSDSVQVLEPNTAQSDISSISKTDLVKENDSSKNSLPSASVASASENPSHNERQKNPPQMKTSSGKSKSKKTSLKKQLQNLLKIDKSSTHDELPSIDESFNAKKPSVEVKLIEQVNNKNIDDVPTSSPEKPSETKVISVSENSISNPIMPITTVVSTTITSTKSVSSRETSPGRVVGVWADNIRHQHQREKQELSDLNDRFRGFLERVKVLESINAGLLGQLDDISKSWGAASQAIIGKYSGPLDRLRLELNDNMYSDADIQARLYRDRYKIDHYRRLLSDDAVWLERLEAKREALKREYANSVEELNSLKQSIQPIEEQIAFSLKQKHSQIAQIDQLNEQVYLTTMERLKVDLQVQTLREEIPFMTDIYAHLLREFEYLKPSNGMDIQLFYRQELEKAIRDIRCDFQALHNAQRKEMEEFYQLKVEELQNDAKKIPTGRTGGRGTEHLITIRTDLNDAQKLLIREKDIFMNLQDKMSKLESEWCMVRREREDAVSSYNREILAEKEKVERLDSQIDGILRGNITLEYEINIYRRLLDGETRRLTVVPEPVTIAEPAPISFGSELGKVFNKKVKRGPIAIKDCTPDGKCVILENTSTEKDIDVSGWVLHRSVQGLPDVTYRIPVSLTMKHGSELRIYARNATGAQDRPPFQLVNDLIDTWGMSTKCETILYNEHGEERATHSQTIVFGSETP